MRKQVTITMSLWMWLLAYLVWVITICLVFWLNGQVAALRAMQGALL